MSSTKCAKCEIVHNLEKEKNKYCKCYGRQCPQTDTGNLCG